MEHFNSRQHRTSGRDFDWNGRPSPRNSVCDFAARAALGEGLGSRRLAKVRLRVRLGEGDRYLTVTTGLGSTQPTGGSGMQPMLTSPP